MPLLLDRYPGLTPAQLDEAHAYAYGGCAIQDLGYYPFGNQFFSDLTHYVRTGDFVRSLLRNARTPDEFAFAIGALSHYVGDSIGHSLATNPSVAADFPRLRARYGARVPYEANPHDHVRVEFAFDINEISKRRFAPSAYLKHVGLQVATDLLGRAFFETYGLHLDAILGAHHERPNFATYRFSVRSFLPRIAYAETVLHRGRMPDDPTGAGDPGHADFVRLEGALAQSDFENGWDQYRKHAGIGTHLLAGVLFLLPPIGPLAEAHIKVPDAHTEDLYVQSVNRSTASIRFLLQTITNSKPAISDRASGLSARLLPNLDLDTGLRSAPGTYRLTDETYYKLLNIITRRGASPIPTGLVNDINAFYADPKAPNAIRRKPAEWARLQAELKLLPTLPTVPEP